MSEIRTFEVVMPTLHKIVGRADNITLTQYVVPGDDKVHFRIELNGTAPLVWYDLAVKRADA